MLSAFFFGQVDGQVLKSPLSVFYVQGDAKKATKNRIKTLTPNEKLEFGTFLLVGQNTLVVLNDSYGNIRILNNPGRYNHDSLANLKSMGPEEMFVKQYVDLLISKFPKKHDHGGQLTPGSISEKGGVSRALCPVPYYPLNQFACFDSSLVFYWSGSFDTDYSLEIRDTGIDGRIQYSMKVSDSSFSAKGSELGLIPGIYVWSIRTEGQQACFRKPSESWLQALNPKFWMRFQPSVKTYHLIPSSRLYSPLLVLKSMG